MRLPTRNPDRPVFGSELLLWLVFPIASADTMRRQVAIYSVADRRKKVLFTDQLEHAVMLQIVLHWTDQLCEAKRYVQL